MASFRSPRHASEGRALVPFHGFAWGVMSGFDHWFSGLDSVSGVSPLVLAGAALAALVLTVALVTMARGRRQVKLRPRLLKPCRQLAPQLRLACRPGDRESCSRGWSPCGRAMIRPPRAARSKAAPPNSPCGRSRPARRSPVSMQLAAPRSRLPARSRCSRTPETLAAAIAYVDARLSAARRGQRDRRRDSGAGDAFERLRRAIEADRYGLVAHVLTTRGCDADNCPTLNLMRDSTHVASNLKDRTFDANVVLHAGSWRSDGSPVASATVNRAIACLRADARNIHVDGARGSDTVVAEQVRFPVVGVDPGRQHHERGAVVAASAQGRRAAAHSLRLPPDLQLLAVRLRARAQRKPQASLPVRRCKSRRRTSLRRPPGRSPIRARRAELWR